MKLVSQTKESQPESASRKLQIDKLTVKQKESMARAVGSGLWAPVRKGLPISASAIQLITEKLRFYGLLP